MKYRFEKPGQSFSCNINVRIKFINNLIVNVLHNINRKDSSKSAFYVMLQANQDSTEVGQLMLILTFRKLNIRSIKLDNSKVTIIVTTYQSNNRFHTLKPALKCGYEISMPRLIKNGTACFYGESIIITEKLTKFRIDIFQVVSLTENDRMSKKLLFGVEVNQNQLCQIKQKKNTFSSGTQNIELIWQARLLDQHKQENQQDICYDRSLEDFDDLNVTKEINQNIRQIQSRKIYSPAVRGQVCKKRQSSRLDSKRNKRCDLVSESPYKLTIDTNETRANVQKKIKFLSSNVSNQNRQMRELVKQQQQNEVKGNQIVKQKTKGINQNTTNKNQQEKETKKKFKANSLKDGIKYPMTPQNNTHTRQFLNKNKRERFFQKVDFKSLLLTSVIGIIGGVASTQF